MKFAINVRGKIREWSFNFEGREQDLSDWIEDGLDVEQVLYSVPAWAMQTGLWRVWEWWYSCPRRPQEPF